MTTKTCIYRIGIAALLFVFVLNCKAQTSVSFRSQWLDPTNLFTEEKPTGEFNTEFSVGGPWSLYFYYAHDLKNLTPIYLIGGVNHTHESIKADSLVFARQEARMIPNRSRVIFVSYQYSETVDNLSWIQPVITWNWNFLRKPSNSVHTFTAEVSPWMSLQRGDRYQDGGFINAQYNYTKHLNKWILSGNLKTIAVKVVEKEWDAFVLGEVLDLSAEFVPLKTTLDIVLNRPLITDEADDLGFTIGIVKEF